MVFYTFIVIVMLLTIAIQLYWNYKNYLQNKQQFINEVQISLDNSLEVYYANLAEANQMAFVNVDSDTLNFEHFSHFKPDSVFTALENEFKKHTGKKIKGFTQILDSVNGYTFSENDNQMTQVKVIKGKKATDSLKLIQGITSIYISIHDDSLNFSKLNPLLRKEFERKNLRIPFALKAF